MNQPFALDPGQGKLMGVCAGLARTTGGDATLIRLLAVVGLFLLGPVAILFYFLAAWLAPAR